MNTTENNKLIAEFMGYPTAAKNEDFIRDVMKYHEDWNLLMPVLERVRECQLFGSQRLIDNINKGLIELDLIRTYRNTIDFIKWFNDNNPKWGNG